MSAIQRYLKAFGLAKQELNRTFVQEGSRNVYINDPVKASSCDYLHNSVTTGKYTIATFLIKFLIAFYMNYANLFFLFISMLQLVGNLGSTSKYGTALPLFVIMLLTASKELLEDSKRHAQDTVVNNRLVKVLSGQNFVPKRWYEVKVGDIVRVENAEFFPADLLLLSSSEPEGICYIETSNLDGETNLKIRQGLSETAHILDPEDASRMDVLKSEMPNNSLYTFEGTLKIGLKDYPVGPDNLLLRGAQLRNTKWVYGVVVFTGHETKLMMNSTKTPVKRTKVEKMVNAQIIFLFFCLICVSGISAFGQLLYDLNNKFKEGILLEPRSIATAIFPDFPLNILSYVVLFSALIPLSLIVTVESVKLIIGTFINSDLDIYYEEKNTPTSARNSALVEELGQVDFIFSDKTGTLTRNIMEFKMCVIGGIPYAEVVPDDKLINLDDAGNETGYHDFATLNHHRKTHQNSKTITQFLTLLAVCHTVIPEADDEIPGNIRYQASSPDEAALVDGAATLGFLFHTRKPKSVTFAVEGINYEYQILHVNEFNSTRKRMSVIVKAPDGRIILFIKGADTVIFERLSPFASEIDNTQRYLEEYANEGLRTLVLAYRYIDAEEYYQWGELRERAATQINGRQEALDNVAELIEKDLLLLGATAIEDRLQDDVADTISTLMEAGIKMWVLTGDRQETAINIGFSCKLITPDMLMIICNEPTKEDTKLFLEQKLAAVKDSMGVSMAKTSKWDRFWMGQGNAKGKFEKFASNDIDPIVLVIDGKSLTYALDAEVHEIFLELGLLCKAVVCCRVSPLQKALVVRLVKKNVIGCVTLAIGDGANDVSMIQAAHVGVGISGQEGLQAARASDFSIGQFKYLKKLLLVHGGWAYSRVTKVISICYYKNITLYLIQFWYSFDNGFSGSTLFETWSSVSSYNVIWTLLPPMVIGVFDQYVSARMLDRYPQLYRLGQTDTFYNHKIFIGWILSSLVHSLSLFYLWTLCLDEGVILVNGLTADNWSFGTMVYITTILTVLIRHCLITDTFVVFTSYAYVGSFFVFMIFFPLVIETK